MSDARLNVFWARPSAEGARALLLEWKRGRRAPSPEVLRWLLDLGRWDALSTPVQELVAEAVEALLGQGFCSLGLKTCTQGDQHHVIARYERGERLFSLVPGGRVTLGWDRKDVALTSMQRAAWNQANDDPAFVRFEQLLDLYFTRLREVALDPLLVEEEPSEALPHIDAEEERGELEAADAVDAAQAAQATCQLLLERAVAREGFRLLSSDEWEHACRGGSARLFRWGDEWPRGIPYGNSTDFTAHRAPNGFGLRMVSDPYQVECVAGGAVFRGGDGGGAVCGGRPQPEPWYSFASAFSYPVVLVGEDMDVLFETAVVRRALSLPDASPGGR